MNCTVLVPSYKRGPALLDCLQAIAGGHRQPEEVIVVLRDTDTDSHDIAAKWLKANPAADIFRVVDVTERGQIAAINRGLDAASGDVIFFTDDDAAPRPDWLQRLAAHYADPAIGGAGGRDVVHHGDHVLDCTARTVGQLTCYGRVVGNHHCAHSGGPIDVDHIKGVNMSFRRELIKPFDSSIWGPHFNDTDQSLNVKRAGYRVIYDPDAVVDHYPAERPDNPAGRNLADPKQVYLDAHDQCHLLRKHLPAWQMLLWLPYLALLGDYHKPGIFRLPLEALLGKPDAINRCAAVLAGTSAALHNNPRPESL